ncbi:ATP-binding protein [Streptomyces xiamenensis]
MAGTTADGHDPALMQFTARQFAPSPHWLAAARTFTRDTLHRWDLGHIADDAADIASELVANAVQHVQPEPGTAPQPIWLALDRRDTSVLCIVFDTSSTEPTLHTPTPLSETGRGLVIVQALSEDWGCNIEVEGKLVWAQISSAHR